MGNISSIDNSIEIYLISLPKDQERRNHLNVKPDYIYAVDGSLIKDNNTKLTKGELGCYLSHVHMLKKAIKSKNKYVMIIEDDVGHIDTSKLMDYINNAPSDFDLLYLSYNYHEYFESYNQVTYLHGNQCYIVNTDNITQQKIDSLFPIVDPFDCVVASKFKTYIIEPKVVDLGEDSNYSNTQNIR
jgi:hypothetical protein